MIKMYSMPSCKDCAFLKDQLDDRFEIIDIGSDVHLLKEFLKIRDNHPLFKEIRKESRAGIPCFVLEDGTVTLDPSQVGLIPRPEDGQSCSLEDHLKGKAGC